LVIGSRRRRLFRETRDKVAEVDIGGCSDTDSGGAKKTALHILDVVSLRKID
jgi:hypothetical protein